MLNKHVSIERKHGEVGFYLSGHGYFRSYLQKMGKTLSADCLGIEDNADHTFLWATRRASLVADVGMITPYNIFRALLTEKDVRNHVAHYVEGILRTKKETQSVYIKINVNVSRVGAAKCLSLK